MMMKKYFDDLAYDLTNDRLNRYWPGFESVAYAPFDNDYVYLFNHPKMKNDPHNNFQIFNRDDQFNGCTLILYDNYPTAIVDLKLYKEYASLYSILVHELFHGFQFKKGEKRFANELLGITYPLTTENVELRIQERDILYKAVMEEDPLKKKLLINHFISLREKRAMIIHDYLSYESFVETIEGPAFYVELKSFTDKSSQAYDVVLKKYGQDLIDHTESISHIRRSCYSSGLFICLLLDEFMPDWKEKFWETEDTIYDLLKQIPGKINQVDHIEISPKTEQIINYTLDKRNSSIKTFEQQKGFHILIEGKIIAKSFDPMNMVLFEDKLLHKNFLNVEINEKSYLVQQPVIAYFKDKIQNITKLHLILENKPVENADSLVIDSLGSIKGKYINREGIYYLYVQ